MEIESVDKEQDIFTQAPKITKHEHIQDQTFVDNNNPISSPHIYKQKNLPQTRLPKWKKKLEELKKKKHKISIISPSDMEIPKILDSNEKQSVGQKHKIDYDTKQLQNKLDEQKTASFKNWDESKANKKLVVKHFHDENVPSIRDLTKKRKASNQIGSKRKLKKQSEVSHSVFVCDICKNLFSSSASLKNHYENVHKINKKPLKKRTNKQSITFNPPKKYKKW